jgi:hypothetical protein
MKRHGLTPRTAKSAQVRLFAGSCANPMLRPGPLSGGPYFISATGVFHKEWVLKRCLILRNGVLGTSERKVRLSDRQ